jgi:hypothetical protein
MPSHNAAKGRSLERAVKFIQHAILKCDPKLQGTAFTVEANKIVNVSGVRHEIDVFVTTAQESPYEACWIFECKNWKKVVGKNEVMILAKKVAAIRANRGFIVAHRISRDATAQIKLEEKVSFIQCRDEFLSPLNGLELICTTHEVLPTSVGLKERGVAVMEHPRDLEWRNQSCRFESQPVELASFFKAQVDRMILTDQNENQPRYRLEGTHSADRTEKIEFAPGELMIGAIDVEYMVIALNFLIEVRRRKIISKFELKNQGRVFSFEPIDDLIAGKRIEIDFVQRL